MKSKLKGLLAAVGLLALAPGIASAGYLTFDFQNDGALFATGTCGVGCYEVQSVGIAHEIGSDEVPGTNSWTFLGSMKFYENPLFGVGIGSGPGFGWSFADNSGSNDLFGSFSTLLPTANPSVGSVSYTIEGGSGLFAGATGSGFSLITVTNWFADFFTFDEQGRMYVYTPAGSATTPVPEPGMVSLLAAGFAMIGFVAYRRRRTPLPLR